MRALLIKETSIEDNTKVIVSDEKHHHVKNVLRLKVGDEVLLIIGNGKSLIGKIHQVSKKETIISIVKINKTQMRSSFIINLYVGLVKKDALESTIRSAVELGVNQIVFLYTENSQQYELNNTRLEKILENAIEQSNYLFIPVIKTQKMNELDMTTLSNKILATNRMEGNIRFGDTSELNLFVGPEAGFTVEEEKKFTQNNTQLVSIDCGILRTRTAVPAIIGYLHGCREKIDA